MNMATLALLSATTVDSVRLSTTTASKQFDQNLMYTENNILKQIVR